MEVMAESQKKLEDRKAKDGAGVSGTVAPDAPEADNPTNFSPALERGLLGGEGSRLAPRPVTKSRQDPSGKTEKHLRTILGAAFNDLATAEALQEKYDSADKHYREAE